MKYITLIAVLLVVGCTPKNSSNENLREAIDENQRLHADLIESKDELAEVYFYYGVRCGILAESRSVEHDQSIEVYERAYKAREILMNQTNSGVRWNTNEHGEQVVTPNAIPSWFTSQ